MFNIFHANWYIATAGVLTFSIIATGIIHAWERHKLRGDGQRAVVRLKTLLHGTQLEPAKVEALVQEIFEREGRLNLERAMDPALPQVVGSEAQKSLHSKAPERDEVDALVQEILADREPLRAERTSRPEPLRFGASVSTVLDGSKRLEQQAVADLPLKAGAKVRAARNFRSVKQGTLGIITGQSKISFFGWLQPRYVCTFANNIKIHARPKQIEVFDHAYGLEELEQPDFASFLSRQIALKAQQLFAGQHRQVLESRPSMLV